MMEVKLVLGDCIEKMRDLKSDSVHCIMSDIPYGIDYSAWDVTHDNKNSALLGASPAQQNHSLFKTRGKPKNGWSEQDRQRPQEFQRWCAEWLQEAHRVMKPAGALICMTGRQNQHRFTVAAEDNGFIYKDCLVWDKGTAPFRAQAIDRVLEKRGDAARFPDMRLGCLAPTWEPIVWCFKPYEVGSTLTDCFLRDGVGLFSSSVITGNVIKVSSKIEDRLHETQKPLELMEVLVKTFTLEGQTVLDMFMGSGTTGLACTKNNRSFIGIEMLEKYFEISKKRLS